MHTVFDDDGRVFAAICAGANGYILKSITPEKLLEALKDAKDGGAPMTPSVAAKVLQTFAQQSKTKR
jgi:DNA-binding NarL/FixJ family response regulator